MNSKICDWFSCKLSCCFFMSASSLVTEDKASENLRNACSLALPEGDGTAFALTCLNPWPPLGVVSPPPEWAPTWRASAEFARITSFFSFGFLLVAGVKPIILGVCRTAALAVRNIGFAGIAVDGALWKGIAEGPATSSGRRSSGYVSARDLVMAVSFLSFCCTKFMTIRICSILSVSFLSNSSSCCSVVRLDSSLSLMAASCS
mmetsp:Transcript_14382/g.22314  ORF Transcript_14382/g.22314 Transcript_14382/m.22314 type:complete len:204 (-) Transcript_14382:1474-2085(-)